MKSKIIRASDMKTVRVEPMVEKKSNLTELYGMSFIKYEHTITSKLNEIVRGKGTTYKESGTFWNIPQIMTENTSYIIYDCMVHGIPILIGGDRTLFHYYLVAEGKSVFEDVSLKDTWYIINNMLFSTISIEPKPNEAIPYQPGQVSRVISGKPLSNKKSKKIKLRGRVPTASGLSSETSSWSYTEALSSTSSTYSA